MGLVEYSKRVIIIVNEQYKIHDEREVVREARRAFWLILSLLFSKKLPRPRLSLAEVPYI
jgi:hypothetical protein